MKLLRLFFLLAIFLGSFPLGVFAASEVPAGFAPSSIWVSRSKITAGDTINVFTILYNSSDAGITGDVQFNVDTSVIGIKHFTIAAGETATVSLPWTAITGNHVISGTIKNVTNVNTKAPLVLLNTSTDTITVTVAEPPPKPPLIQNTTEVINILQSGVASSAPFIGNAASSVYTVLESIRENTAKALEKKLDQNESSSQSSGEVLGASTEQSTADEDAGIASVFSKIMKGLGAATLFVLSSKTLFYSSLGIITYILIKFVMVGLREAGRP